MQYSQWLSGLPDYAFPRLRALLDPHEPGADPVDMSIGEPKHPAPDFVGEEIARNLGGFAKYPDNFGFLPLREAIAQWVWQRNGVTLDPQKHIMALNGTREGLFNAAIALGNEKKGSAQAAILMPNPFYQCYAVAALALGAEPIYLPTSQQTGFLPDLAAISPDILARCSIFYLCSPTNPHGAVADAAYLEKLIGLALQYDFRILSDECYSEIYRDQPPMSALTVAERLGARDRVLVFNSLSKRSNLPGLRSGFVVGSENDISAIKRLRAYAGAPLPQPLQAVAALAWADETHVQENRALYQAKYQLTDRVFAKMPAYQAPSAGFFLWLKVGNGEEFALDCWCEHGLRVLPGAYLSRDSDAGNPGQEYVRVAMVAPIKILEPAIETLAKQVKKG